MIIVHSNASGAIAYTPLDLAEWFGFTLVNLVFPSSIFAPGNALSFSKKKYETNAPSLRKIFKRAFIIFIPAFLMYWFSFFHRMPGGRAFNGLANTGIMDVLQRIALCYCDKLKF
jgi:predicted acyltransferase